MKDLCISTFVSGDYYANYIPIYIYSILKAYPKYHPIVCSQDRIPENVKKSLAMLKDLGDFDVKENFLSNYPKERNTIMTMMCLFHLPEFEKFRYMYRGDADFFICREKPGLLEQHLKHCDEIDNCYSSIIRKDSYRFSSLYFVKTKEFYKHTLPVIEEYMEKIMVDGDVSKFPTLAPDDPFYKNTLEGSSGDEWRMYNMIKESGLKMPPMGGFRPHHGLHLGIGRYPIGLWARFFSGTDEIKKEYGDYHHYYKWFSAANDDELFLKIMDNTSGKVKQEVMIMDKFGKDLVK